MKRRTTVRIGLLLALVVAASLAAACGSDDDNTLTIYSGRTSSLVRPLFDQFAEETGINVRVRYGASAGLVALLIEEGDSTPADVAFLQDAGALGALANNGLLAPLPDELVAQIDPRFRSSEGLWVGTSGRARTVIYNVFAVDPERDLPASVLGFTAPEWKGRIGWAPTNGSFQAFVTALRLIEGDDVAREWLEAMNANDTKIYPNNIMIVDATARGEIDAGLVNHYYLNRFLVEHGEGFFARNHFYAGDAGALINVAGVGILATSEASSLAEQFVEYLLSPAAQTFFAEETAEYPLIAGIDPVGGVPPLAELDPPDVNLNSLDDLRGTLDLMREAGVLP
jgi:iron(III) transport system substrate-binding protein